MRERNVMFWVALSAYALVCRLLPYTIGVHHENPVTTWCPWNFAPMMAFTLFCGAGVQQSKWAFVVPLFITALGDIGIYLITGNREFGFPPGQFLLYGCYIFTAAMGTLLRARPQVLTALPRRCCAK